MEDLTTDKSIATAPSKPPSASEKRKLKRDDKANEKLERTLSSQSCEKRPFVYWTEKEHSSFLKAVKKGLINDFPKMTKMIRTKSLQQVIDYKTNFLRKLKETKQHPERDYLKYFNAENKKSVKEEKQFIDFLRIYKNEWRHYYEENFPSDKTLK